MIGIDNKLRQTTSTTSLHFIQDHLGSTRALTDGSGNVVQQQQYDSFGNSSGSSLTRYGYTGRERDPDTGLLYYRARWYDAQVGRFITEDPIGFQGGDNFYAYAQNNPLRWRDPLGLQTWDTWDFVKHYYFGGGTSVNLADVGLLNAFQRSSSVIARITEFQTLVLQKAKEEARAQCARDAITGKNHSSYFKIPASSVVTDVTREPGLFSVGHSSFFRTAVGFVYPNCKCRTFHFSATLGFYISDWFQDPLDIGVEPLGIPYRINASWSEDFSGDSSF